MTLSSLSTILTSVLPTSRSRSAPQETQEQKNSASQQTRYITTTEQPTHISGLNEITPIPTPYIKSENGQLYTNLRIRSENGHQKVVPPFESLDSLNAAFKWSEPQTIHHPLGYKLIIQTNEDNTDNPYSNCIRVIESPFECHPEREIYDSLQSLFIHHGWQQEQIHPERRSDSHQGYTFQKRVLKNAADKPEEYRLLARFTPNGTPAEIETPLSTEEGRKLKRPLSFVETGWDQFVKNWTVRLPDLHQSKTDIFLDAAGELTKLLSPCLMAVMTGPIGVGTYAAGSLLTQYGREAVTRLLRWNANAEDKRYKLAPMLAALLNPAIINSREDYLTFMKQYGSDLAALFAHSTLLDSILQQPPFSLTSAQRSKCTRLFSDLFQFAKLVNTTTESKRIRVEEITSEETGSSRTVTTGNGTEVSQVTEVSCTNGTGAVIEIHQTPETREHSVTTSIGGLTLTRKWETPHQNPHGAIGEITLADGFGNALKESSSLDGVTRTVTTNHYSETGDCVIAQAQPPAIPATPQEYSTISAFCGSPNPSAESSTASTHNTPKGPLSVPYSPRMPLPIIPDTPDSSPSQPITDNIVTKTLTVVAAGLAIVKFPVLAAVALPMLVGSNSANAEETPSAPSSQNRIDIVDTEPEPDPFKIRGNKPIDHKLTLSLVAPNNIGDLEGGQSIDGARFTKEYVHHLLQEIHHYPTGWIPQDVQENLSTLTPETIANFLNSKKELMNLYAQTSIIPASIFGNPKAAETVAIKESSFKSKSVPEPDDRNYYLSVIYNKTYTNFIDTIADKIWALKPGESCQCPYSYFKLKSIGNGHGMLTQFTMGNRSNPEEFSLIHLFGNTGEGSQHHKRSQDPLTKQAMNQFFFGYTVTIHSKQALKDYLKDVLLPNFTYSEQNPAKYKTPYLPPSDAVKALSPRQLPFEEIPSGDTFTQTSGTCWLTVHTSSFLTLFDDTKTKLWLQWNLRFEALTKISSNRNHTNDTPMLQIAISDFLNQTDILSKAGILTPLNLEKVYETLIPLLNQLHQKMEEPNVTDTPATILTPVIDLNNTRPFDDDTPKKDLLEQTLPNIPPLPANYTPEDFIKILDSLKSVHPKIINSTLIYLTQKLPDFESFQNYNEDELKQWLPVLKKLSEDLSNTYKYFRDDYCNEVKYILPAQLKVAAICMAALKIKPNSDSKKLKLKYKLKELPMLSPYQQQEMKRLTDFLEEQRYFVWLNESQNIEDLKDERPFFDLVTNKDLFGRIEDDSFSIQEKLYLYALHALKHVIIKDSIQSATVSIEKDKFTDQLRTLMDIPSTFSSTSTRAQFRHLEPPRNENTSQIYSLKRSEDQKARVELEKSRLAPSLQVPRLITTLESNHSSVSVEYDNTKPFIAPIIDGLFDTNDALESLLSTAFDESIHTLHRLIDFIQKELNQLLVYPDSYQLEKILLLYINCLPWHPEIKDLLPPTTLLSQLNTGYHFNNQPIDSKIRALMFVIACDTNNWRIYADQLGKMAACYPMYFDEEVHLLTQKKFEELSQWPEKKILKLSQAAFKSYLGIDAPLNVSQVNKTTFSCEYNNETFQLNLALGIIQRIGTKVGLPNWNELINREPDLWALIPDSELAQPVKIYESNGKTYEGNYWKYIEINPPMMLIKLHNKTYRVLSPHQMGENAEKTAHLRLEAIQFIFNMIPSFSFDHYFILKEHQTSEIPKATFFLKPKSSAYPPLLVRINEDFSTQLALANTSGDPVSEWFSPHLNHAQHYGTFKIADPSNYPPYKMFAPLKKISGKRILPIHCPLWKTERLLLNLDTMEQFELDGQVWRNQNTPELTLVEKPLTYPDTSTLIFNHFKAYYATQTNQTTTLYLAKAIPHFKSISTATQILTSNEYGTDHIPFTLHENGEFETTEPEDYFYLAVAFLMDSQFESAMHYLSKMQKETYSSTLIQHIIDFEELTKKLNLEMHKPFKEKLNLLKALTRDSGNYNEVPITQTAEQSFKLPTYLFLQERHHLEPLWHSALQTAQASVTNLETTIVPNALIPNFPFQVNEQTQELYESYIEYKRLMNSPKQIIPKEKLPELLSACTLNLQELETVKSTEKTYLLNQLSFYQGCEECSTEIKSERLRYYADRLGNQLDSRLVHLIHLAINDDMEAYKSLFPHLTPKEHLAIYQATVRYMIASTFSRQLKNIIKEINALQNTTSTSQYLLRLDALIQQIKTPRHYDFDNPFAIDLLGAEYFESISLRPLQVGLLTQFAQESNQIRQAITGDGKTVAIGLQKIINRKKSNTPLFIGIPQSQIKSFYYRFKQTLNRYGYPVHTLHIEPGNIQKELRLLQNRFLLNPNTVIMFSKEDYEFLSAHINTLVNDPSPENQKEVSAAFELMDYLEKAEIAIDECDSGLDPFETTKIGSTNTIPIPISIWEVAFDLIEELSINPDIVSEFKSESGSVNAVFESGYPPQLIGKDWYMQTIAPILAKSVLNSLPESLKISIAKNQLENELIQYLSTQNTLEEQSELFQKEFKKWVHNFKNAVEKIQIAKQFITNRLFFALSREDGKDDGRYYDPKTKKYLATKNLSQPRLDTIPLGPDTFHRDVLITIATTIRTTLKNGLYPDQLLDILKNIQTKHKQIRRLFTKDQKTGFDILYQSWISPYLNTHPNLPKNLNELDLTRHFDQLYSLLQYDRSVIRHLNLTICNQELALPETEYHAGPEVIIGHSTNGASATMGPVPSRFTVNPNPIVLGQIIASLSQPVNQEIQIVEQMNLETVKQVVQEDIEKDCRVLIDGIGIIRNTSAFVQWLLTLDSIDEVIYHDDKGNHIIEKKNGSKKPYTTAHTLSKTSFVIYAAPYTRGTDVRIPPGKMRYIIGPTEEFNAFVQRLGRGRLGYQPVSVDPETGTITDGHAYVGLIQRSVASNIKKTTGLHNQNPIQLTDVLLKLWLDQLEKREVGELMVSLNDIKHIVVLRAQAILKATLENPNIDEHLLALAGQATRVEISFDPMLWNQFKSNQIKTESYLEIIKTQTINTYRDLLSEDDLKAIQAIRVHNRHPKTVPTRLGLETDNPNDTVTTNMQAQQEEQQNQNQNQNQKAYQATQIAPWKRWDTNCMTNQNTRLENCQWESTPSGTSFNSLRPLSMIDPFAIGLHWRLNPLSPDRPIHHISAFFEKRTGIPLPGHLNQPIYITNQSITSSKPSLQNPMSAEESEHKTVPTVLVDLSQSEPRLLILDVTSAENVKERLYSLSDDMFLIHLEAYDKPYFGQGNYTVDSIKFPILLMKIYFRMPLTNDESEYFYSQIPSDQHRRWLPIMTEIVEEHIGRGVTEIGMLTPPIPKSPPLPYRRIRDEL